MKTARDFEYDYLAVSGQLAELLRRKAAAYALDAELQALHLKVLELGERVIVEADSPATEAEYLGAISTLEERLRERMSAYSLSAEIPRLHSHLICIGEALGWTRPGAPDQGVAEVETRVSAIERQLERLESAVASAEPIASPDLATVTEAE